jgi:hypothetical protein
MKQILSTSLTLKKEIETRPLDEATMLMNVVEAGTSYNHHSSPLSQISKCILGKKNELEAFGKILIRHAKSHRRRTTIRLARVSFHWIDNIALGAENVVGVSNARERLSTASAGGFSQKIVLKRLHRFLRSPKWEL